MQIKLDEDLPKALLVMLLNNGYQVKRVFDQGMSGWKDHDIWQAVQDEHRFLITADKGFADVRRYPPGSHNGMMLLRPDQDGINPILELIEKVLRAYDLNSLEGTITVVTPRNIRVRRPNPS